jgi:SET domain-containing protein
LNSEYLEEQLEAKDSSIHGMGVFTKILIPQDSVIMRITGEVIDEDECCRREDEENNVYIFYNGDDNYIDVANTEVIRYINHECNCNCYIDDGDEASLLLCAARDIQAGEELTIDYGYEEIYDLCSCEECSANRKEKE